MVTFHAPTNMCNKEGMLWTFSELLLGILVLFGVIVGLLVTRSIRQHIRKRERSVQAVVTEIHVEAGNWGSGWVMTTACHRCSAARMRQDGVMARCEAYHAGDIRIIPMKWKR